MGEVYRARDSRLGRRDVAINTLGASLVHDPDMVARFEREAMAASALNHPGILTIYDIAQDGVDRAERCDPVVLPYGDEGWRCA